jgi:hypothetical protein
MITERGNEQKWAPRLPGRDGRPRLVRIVNVTVLSAAVFGFQGCGERDELPEITKQAVKFDDVPENVRAAAKKAIPGVKFDEAWKNLAREGKLHSYEIRGKNAADGKTREVRVSLTGEILEME